MQAGVQIISGSSPTEWVDQHLHTPRVLRSWASPKQALQSLKMLKIEQGMSDRWSMYSSSRYIPCNIVHKNMLDGPDHGYGKPDWGPKVHM